MKPPASRLNLNQADNVGKWADKIFIRRPGLVLLGFPSRKAGSKRFLKYLHPPTLLFHRHDAVDALR